MMQIIRVRIFRFRKLLFFALALFSSTAVANPEVLGLVLGKSDQTEVESKYEIVWTAVISNVRKSVFELDVEQIDSIDIYTQNKPVDIALYFDDESILSDVHLVYESWEYTKATELLAAHFTAISDDYPVYGEQSIVYSWPSYQVVCFSDKASGYTHIIFGKKPIDK